MLGLSPEQIVDAANAIYQDAIQAGSSQAGALAAVEAAAASYGISAAEVDQAFQTAYGGAAYAPAVEFVEEVRPVALMPEQVVDAATRIYAEAGGGSPGAAAVAQAAADIGLTATDLATAFTTAYGGAAWTPDAQAAINYIATRSVLAVPSAPLPSTVSPPAQPGVPSTRIIPAGWVRVGTMINGSEQWILENAAGDRALFDPRTGTLRLATAATSLPPVRGVVSTPAREPSRLTAEQIVDAANRVYTEAGGGSPGAAAVAQAAADAGLTATDLATAFTTAYGGAAWTPDAQAAINYIATRGTPGPPAQPGAPPPPPPRQVPVPRNLTPAQIVQATSAIFAAQANPRAGIDAVKAAARTHGYTWEQVVDAYRSVGGPAWADFQRVMQLAGEPIPAAAGGALAWLIPAVLAALAFLR